MPIAVFGSKSRFLKAIFETSIWQRFWSITKQTLLRRGNGRSVQAERPDKY